ncbi:hypothetical protein PFISCL1PPCAC_7562 [Pristionchus fissidentatus]|uniref:Uncharacterized protein n=1 Tax=Pristionchus fissidentatus TaxID=1538716 RepID=A0AAV5V9F7_9BILA|nr:hypothetical protein PFISCL1PPCAC_7562 [Pristionchus fissidentatus]
MHRNTKKISHIFRIFDSWLKFHFQLYRSKTRSSSGKSLSSTCITVVSLESFWSGCGSICLGVSSSKTVGKKNSPTPMPKK